VPVIPRITHGSDAAGLVRYLLGRGRHDEHTLPQVIAAAPGMSAPIGTLLTGEEARSLAFDLDLPHRLYGTEVPVRIKQPDGTTLRQDAHVWHLSLSLAPGDPTLSDEHWAEIVTGAIHRLGFDADPLTGRAGCPWVAIRHGANRSGCDHVHVAVSRVRDDGTVAKNWNDRLKLGSYASGIEDRERLTVVAGRRHGCVPEPGRVEQDLAERRGQPETARESLQRQLRAAATVSRDEAEYVRRLRKAGIVVRPRYAKGGTDSVTGYSVGLRTSANGKIDWFGASSLAHDLSLPALRASWGSTEAERRAAAELWSSPSRSGGRGAEEQVYAAATQGEAAAYLGRVVDRLSTLAVDDPGWVAAARDTAGILANLAGRLEPDRPGPLSRASDGMAQAAQRPGGRPRGFEASSVNLSGVAAVAAQAMVPGGPGAWLRLIAQLRRVATAVQEAEEARGVCPGRRGPGRIGPPAPGLPFARQPRDRGRWRDRTLSPRRAPRR
jgi:hypothetical protein